MTNHIPLCPVCNENEVGTFLGSDEFCSSTCQSLALDWEGGEHQKDELYEEECGTCADCGARAETYTPNGTAACRVCWSYEDEDYYADQLEGRASYAASGDDFYEDAWAAQYDNDPSPYDGTYSEL